MKKLFFSLIFLSFSICVSAQTVKIRSAASGKVSVTKGKLRSTIDLSKDVAGCPYVPAKYKSSLDRKGCTAPPAKFKLIDATVKNNQVFLVLESEAMGNCNVCGQCGASEAYALIWLKLDSRLRVLDRKSVPIEDCRAHISFIGYKPSDNQNNQSEKLDFKNDLLIAEFEETLYTDNSSTANYTFTHLEYNRKTPEKGFIIKTEKRAESSAK